MNFCVSPELFHCVNVNINGLSASQTPQDLCANPLWAEKIDLSVCNNWKWTHLKYFIGEDLRGGVSNNDMYLKTKVQLDD